MKVVEILELGRKFVELLQKSCIKIDDVRFVDMYYEYKTLIKEGNKKSYVIALLSEKYHISERKVYYLIKKLSQDCNLRAV